MGAVSPLSPTAALTDAIFESYKGREDWRRDHLGASVLGQKCDRYVWLSFRWASDPGHSGRMLRLFDRGKREEAAVIWDLRRVGIEVLADDGSEQFVAELPGHLGGSVDGVLPNGIPGDDRPMLLEVKTHSTKSFARLQHLGVKRAKPEHCTQVQTYMHGRPEKATLYVAVCKDTDDMLLDVIDYDAKHATAAVERAEAISLLDEAPPKLDPDQPPCVLTSKDGTRWPCQFYEQCHGKTLPKKSCRTCTSVTPHATGDWSCGMLARDDHTLLAPEHQRAACEDWCPNHTIINASVVRISGHRQVEFQFADGETVKLGRTQD